MRYKWMVKVIGVFSITAIILVGCNKEPTGESTPTQHVSLAPTLPTMLVESATPEQSIGKENSSWYIAYPEL